MKCKMSCPQELILKESIAQPGKLGVWCQSPIKCNKQYGPFLGKKVPKAPSHVEPCEVWKVVKENGKTLHYVDGSKYGNWMRHISCAPSRTENNVEFVQQNFKIYYRVVKDVAAGEELLIWLDETDKLNELTKTKQPAKKHHSKEPLSSPSCALSSLVVEDASSNDFAPVDLLVKEVIGTKIRIINPNHIKSEPVEDLPNLKEETSSSTSFSCDVGKSAKDKKSSPKKFEYQFQLTKLHIVKGRQGQKQYKCDVCVGMYRHGFSLKRHFIRNHVNYNYLSEADIANCNINTNVIKSSQILSDVPVKDYNGTKGGRKGLKGNSENLLPSDVFRCHLCNSHFGEKSILRAHISNHPDTSTQKRFPCSQCQMTFSHKQNLVRHLSVHSGVKPYCCKYCNKCFPTIANQKRHERIHEGLKPYSCNHCSSSFTQSGDLRKHIKKQHPKYYHTCTMCPKYFSNASNLRDHILKVHSSNNVAFQSSATVTAEGLLEREQEVDVKQAVQSPQQDLKHSCSTCNKRFQSYINMCRHKRYAHQELQAKRPKPRSSESPYRNGKTYATGRHNDKEIDISETEFYMTVAHKISDNLLNYLDGKVFHFSKPRRIDSFRDKGNKSGSRNVQWQQYNFPPDFDISRLEKLDIVTSNCLTTSSDHFYNFGSLMSESALDLNANIRSNSYSSESEGESRSTSSEYTDDRLDNDSFELVGRNIPITYICSVCMERFNSDIAIEEHKINNHTNVFCTHIEIEGDKDIPPELCLQYCSPVGALTQCSVPPLTEKNNSQLQCTKCQSSFDSVSDLHMHILECGSNADLKSRQHFSSRYSRKRGRPMRRHHLWISKSFMLQKNRKLPPKAEAVVTPKEESRKTPTIISSENVSNFACRVCLKSFVYLAAFERHQRGCLAQSNGKKVKPRSPLKPSSKCESCPYCKRVFIYITSLRKHTREGCPKKPAFCESEKSSIKSAEKKKEEILTKSASSKVNEKPVHMKGSQLSQYNPPPLLSRQSIIEPKQNYLQNQPIPLPYREDTVTTMAFSQPLCSTIPLTVNKNDDVPLSIPLPIPLPAVPLQPVYFPETSSTATSLSGQMQQVMPEILVPLHFGVSQKVSPSCENSNSQKQLTNESSSSVLKEVPSEEKLPCSEVEQPEKIEEKLGDHIQLPEFIKTEGESPVLSHSEEKEMTTKSSEEKELLNSKEKELHAEGKVEFKSTTLYQQLHSCPYCLRKFCYLANYRRHIKDICLVKRNKRALSGKEEQSSSATPPTIGSLAPIVRGQIEDSVMNIIQGQSGQTDFVNSAVVAAAVEEPVANNANSRLKSFSCNVCFKIFLSYWKLLQHRLSHKLQSDTAEDSTTDIPVDFNANVENILHASSPSPVFLNEDKVHKDNTPEEGKNGVNIGNFEENVAFENNIRDAATAETTICNVSLPSECTSHNLASPEVSSIVRVHPDIATTKIVSASSLEITSPDNSGPARLSSKGSECCHSTVSIDASATVDLTSSTSNVNSEVKPVLPECDHTLNGLGNICNDRFSGDNLCLEKSNTNLPGNLSDIVASDCTSIKREVSTENNEKLADSESSNKSVYLEIKLTHPKINTGDVKFQCVEALPVACSSAKATVESVDNSPIDIKREIPIVSSSNLLQDPDNKNATPKKVKRTNTVRNIKPSQCLKPSLKAKDVVTKGKKFTNKSKKAPVLPSSSPLNVKSSKSKKQKLSVLPQTATRKTVRAKVESIKASHGKSVPKGAKTKELDSGLTCDLCGKTFSIKYNCKRHFLMVHKREFTATKDARNIKSTKKPISTPKPTVVKSPRGRPRKVVPECEKIIPDKKFKSSQVQKKVTKPKSVRNSPR